MGRCSAITTEPMEEASRKRWVTVAEALFAYLLVLVLPRLTPRWLCEWQLAHVYCTPFNHLLFFFVPLVMAVFLGRRPVLPGVSFSDMKSQWRIGYRSSLILLAFATWPIGLLADWGLGYATWGGGAILALIQIPVFLCVTRIVAPLPQPAGAAPTRVGTAVVLLVPVIALAAMVLLAPVAKTGAYAIHAVILTGLGEELFYRGYLQERFNSVLGRPYRYRGISWGAGLIIAAVLFGLSHPLFRGGHDWPWALWTAALGLTLGMIREKANSVLPAALAHGLFDVAYLFIG